MFVTLLGIITLVRLLQSLKAPLLMVVTPAGIVTLVKFFLPILPGTYGAISLVTFTHPSSASDPTLDVRVLRFCWLVW